MKKLLLDRIKNEGLLAVLRGPSEELTIEAVEALVLGGVIGIEITFTTPNALEVVEKLAHRFSDSIILGMGTVTRVDQPMDAKNAGAKFLVSPHTEKKLLKAMLQTDLPVFAGALSPSEVMRANDLGADVIKIFPGSLVGPSYIKALRGPFPGLNLMPTGGVSKDNIKTWFDAGAFAVGAGSSLCPKNWILEKQFSNITENAIEYKRIVNESRNMCFVNL